jgi:D-xylose transport system permease protein
VLIAVAAGIVMTFVTNRTRFGRYVFAIGGNPEAASLAGIKTRWVTMKVFMIMGMLAALSSAISSARLNASTNALGTLDELLVIAAAVIGGTSLAGGSGTVMGAMLGALLMQSLQSGMGLLGIDTTLQNMVVGAVLVIAVWLDTMYKKRI